MITVQVFFGIDSFVEYKAESMDDANRLKEWLYTVAAVTGVRIV